MQRDCRDENTRPFEPVVASFFFFKGNEEILIGDAENLFQGYQFADTDVMYATFDLRIDAPADVKASQLELRCDLILCHLRGVAQSTDVCAKGLIMSNGLHSAASLCIKFARNSLQSYLMIYRKCDVIATKM